MKPSASGLTNLTPQHGSNGLRFVALLPDSCHVDRLTITVIGHCVSCLQMCKLIIRAFGTRQQETIKAWSAGSGRNCVLAALIAKELMDIPGFREGVLYTKSLRILRCCRQVPVITPDAVRAGASAAEQISQHFPESQRLVERLVLEAPERQEGDSAPSRGVLSRYAAFIVGIIGFLACTPRLLHVPSSLIPGSLALPKRPAKKAQSFLSSRNRGEARR